MTIGLESVEGVSIGIAHGSLTLDEIKESAATMWRVVGGREIPALWDLRDAQFDLALTEVRELGAIPSPTARYAVRRVEHQRTAIKAYSSPANASFQLQSDDVFCVRAPHVAAF